MWIKFYSVAISSCNMFWATLISKQNCVSQCTVFHRAKQYMVKLLFLELKELWDHKFFFLLLCQKKLFLLNKLRIFLKKHYILLNSNKYIFIFFNSDFVVLYIFLLIYFWIEDLFFFLFVCFLLFFVFLF